MAAATPLRCRQPGAVSAKAPVAGGKAPETVVLDSDDEGPAAFPDDPAFPVEVQSKHMQGAFIVPPAKRPRCGPEPDMPQDAAAPKLPPDEPPLSAKQEELLDKVFTHGQNVFFTGAAGTGKSRTMRELIRRSPEASTFVTALTGMAATHLPRGTTLHSFAGIGLGKGTKEDVLTQVLSSRKAVKNWNNAKILIVDEASMMSKALFEKLEYVARKVRKKEQPFGGVVLCLCGDFFQLPPVSRGASGDDALFCFESPAWAACLANGGCFELTEVFRQKDARLLAMLSEVRHNQVTEAGLRILGELRRELKVQQGIEPTRLFPTNSKADQVNLARLAALPGGEGLQAVFEAKDQVPDGAYLVPGAIDQMSMFARRLELKVGAQVMLLKNTTQTLVNGSRGVVEGFQRVSVDGEDLPVVRFMSGEVRVVHRADDDKDIAGGRKIRRSQVPLRLSWAITIHKSQGMSIDFLEVDLRHVFEAGQAYVALSRARTMEGLRVLSFDPRKFWTSPKVLEFYKRHVRPI